ncbi:MAG: hypothetical protein H6668_18995 [Ardenticatenaceae bacterium]|nr:hypothetical protein [Ardenticatenaceae bacterium]
MEQEQGASPALLAANARLFALRAGRTQSDKAHHEETAVSSPPTTAAFIQALPPHLGWGSVAVTAVCRRSQPPEQIAIMQPQTFQPASLVSPPLPTVTPLLKTQTTKLYPNIAQAMLKNEVTSAARLWLLLRHIDGEGRGWLRLDEQRQRLCRKQSADYFCGWRQFRNLLAQGEDVYWTRDKERIWLRGTVAVAHLLGVTRLTGAPVVLPLTAVYGGIGLFRAHLYASRHSGRKEAAPISRAVLRQQSGVAGRTQRHYDLRARVQRTRNVAVGERAANVSWETIGWEQGRAVFIMKDRNGRYGSPNQTYAAWQLPNSYSGPHRRCGRGRQRKMNRQLVDLVQTGMRGNGQRQQISRCYFRNGKTAVLQHKASTTYWPNQRQDGGRTTAYWHVVSGD